MTSAPTFLVTGAGGHLGRRVVDLLLEAKAGQAIVADVFGKTVEVVPVSDEQLLAGLIAAGVPKPFAELGVAFDANTRAGKIDLVSDAVAKLTGKPPAPLRDILAANNSALAA